MPSLLSLFASIELFALVAQTPVIPGYFAPVFLILLVAGAVAALVAVVLGFQRAQAFGASTRWFALAALCLLLYHAQLAVMLVISVIGANRNDFSLAFSFVSFFNLFIVLAAVCAIMGFVRLTDSR